MPVPPSIRRAQLISSVSQFQGKKGSGLTPHGRYNLQDTIIAIRKGGTKLAVGNVAADKYPTVEFETDPKQARARVHVHVWGGASKNTCTPHDASSARGMVQACLHGVTGNGSSGIGAMGAPASCRC